MQSPVLFLVFNRPIHTERVFSRIREAQPLRLYVACDGARPENHHDNLKIAEVKSIVSRVDWNCDLRTLYRDTNLGCGLAVSSAIDWFFEYEEEGIILEDDCLPSNSFFLFCDEMLNLYRNEERIALVAGYNKAQEWKSDKYDYFYSQLGAIWGWATWRRAWCYYDFQMNSLENLVSSNWFVDNLGLEVGLRRQRQLLNAKALVASQRLDTWDYQWACARHVQNGMSCMPARSLITNIGFDNEATHTKQAKQDSIVAQELSFPLRVNPAIIPDTSFDELLLPDRSRFRYVFSRIKALIINAFSTVQKFLKPSLRITKLFNDIRA